MKLRKYHLFIFIPFSILLSCTTHKESNVIQTEQNNLTINSKTRIAFGSCNRQDSSQLYWNTIESFKPELWIWMGDNIYGDTDDMNIMSKKYDKLKSNKHYKTFSSSKPIVGTWDDHDYGSQDGNRLFKYKKESKSLLCDFLNLPEDHPVRQHEGAYYSYEHGNNPSIRIILLDTRSFQDPLKPNPTRKTRYLKSNGTILGNKQWEWLENEMKSSTADLNIIVSSIQFIAEEHKYEKWANFPDEKKKMISLIQKFPDKRFMFISGDRHLTEISKLSLDSLPYPLYDFTSSGLTHSYLGVKENNKHRISKLSGETNFGLITAFKTDSITDYKAYMIRTDGSIIDSTLLIGLAK